MRTGSFEVRVVASLHAFPRVGLIVPKHRHSSVERNRVKRRLRELLRLELLPVLRTLPLPLDVVLRASALAYERSYVELGDEMQQVTRRLAPLAQAQHAPLTRPASETRRESPRTDDVR